MSKFAYQKFCQAGVLKNLYPCDLTLPLEKLQSVLWAYYTGGFAKAINHEEIVASVFTSHGYEMLVTSISMDGGMVAILTKGAERIGIQIKDRENAIIVEQILVVTGALVRGGNTRGVYVKTSNSQAGEDFTARSFNAKGDPIELVDAKRLYDVLGLVQIPPYSSQEIFLSIHALDGIVRVKASDSF
jgi:restriction system protein